MSAHTPGEHARGYMRADQSCQGADRRKNRHPRQRRPRTQAHHENGSAAKQGLRSKSRHCREPPSWKPTAGRATQGTNEQRHGRRSGRAPAHRARRPPPHLPSPELDARDRPPRLRPKKLLPHAPLDRQHRRPVRAKRALRAHPPPQSDAPQWRT